MNNFSWLIESVIVESYPILCKYIIAFQNKYKYDVIDDNTIQNYFIWICNYEYNNFKIECIDAGILFNKFEISIRFYLYKFVKKYCYINVN